ncbi:MAG: hypothetical protein ACK4SA_21720 [Caldilinea sp.]
MSTSLSLDSLQVKALLKEAMLELMLERREEFAEFLVEALEDVGLSRAIDVGRTEEYVDRDEIMAILDPKS